MKTRKNVVSTILIGLTLIVQLMNPTRAYADGENPPPPAEPSDVPKESTPNEKPLPTKIPTEAPDTLPEILEDITTKTNVVALDENGKALPLVTEEAAAVVATGDPVWCPAGQAPTPGANGCTVSYLTLADLVAAEGGTIAANGTIWITTGPVADSNPILIDGTTYTNWANYALTLQGGWDGVSGSTTISSNSIFSVPISINTWLGNVTINNLTVQNTTGTGLSVETSGMITANNISANGNANRGAVLRGMRGVTVTGTNVFNNNAEDGLRVSSPEGYVTVNNITANENAMSGTSLAAYGGVTVTGTNVFSNNGHIGLRVSSPEGNITVNNITANENAMSGTSLATYGDVTVTGPNVFNNNALSGLEVRGGNLTLNNVTANGNQESGALLFSVSGNTTVTGTNVFNNNAEDGLRVSSRGDITLNEVTADGNGGSGAELTSSFGNITLTGTNEFNNNADNGLVVASFENGNIILNTITAMGNNTDVYLFTPDNATIDNSTNLPIGSLDALAVCGTLALNHVSASDISYPVSGVHTFVDIFGQVHTVNCDPKIYVDGRLLGALPVTPAHYEFDLSCDSQTLYPVDLPNGDKVTIVCPVSGRALISRLDNTTIPSDLPAGYAYASAFSVSILQDDEPIPVITEGGHVEVSFQVPSQEDNTYSILFWDNGTWVPLNDFLIGPDNNPQSFALNPGITTDLRQILSGVQLVTRNGVQRVEVSTNFPGVFALAQQ